MIQEFDINILNLVKKKIFYPYEYISVSEKSKEKFTSKEKIYSSLTSRKIMKNNNNHVLKVWNAFQIKMIKYYSEFFLKCNVLLLADLLKKFKNDSLKKFSESLSAQDEMLCLIWTKVELELISNPDIYFFFEKGMGGGVS